MCHCDGGLHKNVVVWARDLGDGLSDRIEESFRCFSCRARYDDVDGALPARVVAIRLCKQDAGDGLRCIDVGVLGRPLPQLRPGAEAAEPKAIVVLGVAALLGYPVLAVANRDVADVGEGAGDLPLRDIVAGALGLGFHPNVNRPGSLL
ncbi:hypothetical protein SDC9_175187 [bioreactor metagenome]|uniref:Uncharacterized protein n=1 Tax=bioreactor metagenome TaxID=1076179 RepID=A0A645GVT5_9ZZZZ